MLRPSSVLTFDLTDDREILLYLFYLFKKIQISAGVHFYQNFYFADVFTLGEFLKKTTSAMQVGAYDMGSQKNLASHPGE